LENYNREKGKPSSPIVGDFTDHGLQHDDPLALKMTENLHSPHRQLIELRMEHADLDNLIDRAAEQTPIDEISLRRMKKRRLILRDQIARMELMLDPKEPA
jgi:hypothetical protein